jgi:hypothetical protein
MTREASKHMHSGMGISKAFHEKAGRSQVDSWFFMNMFFLPPSSHGRHASIRTLEERSHRSVHVGRSQFSRCCHLIGDLSLHSRVERGPGH